MNILCIIPARLGSTRLARKMLIDLGGKPLIQRTFLQASQCPEITKVIVATDSDEIAEVVTKVGGEVAMTPAELPTGSDRTAYVAEQHPDMDVVINLQGDEPFIQPEMLTALVQPYLLGEMPAMSTLAFPLANSDEFHDPNIVKVIMDQQRNAIYFSRAPIPHFREQVPAPVLHHMGVYAFRRDFLLQYTQMPQTPLEKAELLEQLRAIEYGHKIRVCRIESGTIEINTAEDLARANQALAAVA